MDFIKNAVSGGNNEAKAQGGQNAGQSSGGKAQNQDYVDKAFDFASKKAGRDFDPKTDEQITDAGRSAYEKFSGSKVDSKYSN
ncbi:hypothetical protein S7711_03129 [Stachybotrys chartarum IBT 7711]|uniref:Uncharacterized protein n=1 Tax=Stachybotrys chartarum (strain CBS 109288 / IBT 7711) TaxID=1280523 RepID=A0A084B8F5_STACB|nr:hypothetical protein S7711_03129 [Stachybotrys chartarum IBT 7711]KFA55370.1 hypothetical protein S40293_05715 [Stachybotrys chartarum IBT 40293]